MQAVRDMEELLNEANCQYLGSTYIEFDDVEVPVGNLLGTENHGFALLMNSNVFTACSIADLN